MVVKGTIVKGIAGFYYVDDGKQVYECKARGVFKNDNMKPSVGDEVDLDISGDTPVIIKIYERCNLFARPPVSNIEQFVVVSALSSPKPNLFVIDRFLTSAELNGVDIVMCFTKKDIAGQKIIDEIKDIYSGVYPAVFIDATKKNDIEQLIPYMKGKKSALAGPSGVGKSTILNALCADSNMETGNVSEKTKRGRHTTRHVELFRCDFGGMIFDTPGFTSLDIPSEADEEDIQFLFPDIAKYVGQCRFNGCRHVAEPGCAVRAAVDEDRIHRKRYESYCDQIKQIQEREKNRY